MIIPIEKKTVIGRTVLIPRIKEKIMVRRTGMILIQNKGCFFLKKKRTRHAIVATAIIDEVKENPS